VAFLAGGADPREADLRYASLRDAKITVEQLKEPRLLQGAAMP
jgi:hypothetical protein